MKSSKYIEKLKKVIEEEINNFIDEKDAANEKLSKKCNCKPTTKN